MSALLRFWVQPRASRTRIVGMHRLSDSDERIKIQIAAPPVEGAANEALVEFLAKALRIPKSRVAVVRGESSRQKDVACEGITLDEAMAKLMPRG